MHLRIFTFSLLMLLAAGYNAGATHYRGGEITYRNLGLSPTGDATVYELSFRIYADCHHGDPHTIEQDLPLYFAVFDGAGTRTLLDTALYGSYQPTPLNFLSGCYRDTIHYCGKYAVLKRTLNLPLNANGYLIVNQRCCMGVDVVNVSDPGQTGLTLQCAIPGTALLGPGRVNSSPVFRAEPPLRMCIKSSFGIDFDATDADGDSLAYRLVSGLAGGTPGNAKPFPYSTTFAPLAYKFGHSAGQPLGGSGSLSLNAATGMVSGRCSAPGEYLMCVACDEYRGGVRIGTVTRSYVVEFADCNKEVAAGVQRDSAAAASGIDSLSIVRCAGARAVTFTNASAGANAFHWDFGVTGSDDDTSALRNPQFTYPGPGRYPLTLVAYGLNCADTLHGAVWISDDTLTADFSITGGNCLLDTVVLNDNSSAAGGIITQYRWQTGGEAASGRAIGLILQTPGPLVVTHSVASEHGCIASADKTINVRQATISAGLSDTVVAIDLELILQASGGVSYNWEALPPGSLVSYAPGAASTQVQTSVYGKDFMYIVTGRDAQGCAGRDTVRVTVSEQSYIFVPSAFTPNGDGLNDLLRAYVSGGNVLLFAVYNRLGNLVFSTANGREGWDGRHKGQEAAMDVYYWMLKVQSGYSGHELVYGGDVTLVR